MFFNKEVNLSNKFVKKIINNEYIEESFKKFSSTTKLYIFFCNRKRFLNKKIILFFFNIIYLSINNFEFSRLNSLKGSKFFMNYKVLFSFLKFTHFVTEFANEHFRMDSEKFFSEKKYLTEFLIYYKFFLFILFLDKKNKFYYLLIKFRFKLYFNYVLYSIFYFLKLYIINLQNIELNKKVKIRISKIPVISNSNSSYSFYSEVIFNQTDNLQVEKISLSKEDVPLYLFCSDRVNFKTLKDNEFSKILNYIRHIYRYLNIKQNSFFILKKVVKKAIPLSKIIYQRRGRISIPLTSFIYSQGIRNSLGVKLILKENKGISGLSQNSYKNRLLVNLLDLLILNNKDDFIYQSDKDADVRKEAYSRGYFLKTLKSKYTKLK